MNPLARWLRAHGKKEDGEDAKELLREASGLRWQTIHLVAANKSEPRAATAHAIEVGTRALTPHDPVLAIDLLAWFIDHPRSIAVSPEDATAARTSTSDSDAPGEAAE
jgi:hypothetical protein